jgi:hypothetical protein
MMPLAICTAVLLAVEHPDYPRPRSAAQRVKGWNTRQERYNGALLSIAAEHVRDREKDLLRVKWAIDYDGPRRPFTVLAPTLTLPTGGGTYLAVNCDDRAGAATQLNVSSPPGRSGIWYPGPKAFATSAAGKPLTGTLDIQLTELDKLAEGRDIPPLAVGVTVYVQLHHYTPYRGGEAGLSLDAWTGKLWSNVVAVTLK